MKFNADEASEALDIIKFFYKRFMPSKKAQIAKHKKRLNN